MKKILSFMFMLLFVSTFAIAQTENEPSSAESDEGETSTTQTAQDLSSDTQETPKKSKLFDVGGDLRVRLEALDNRDLNSATNDRREFIGTRIRLNVKINPADELEAFFQPQFTGVWGQVNSTSNGSGAVAGGALTSGALRDRELNLHQGYVVWKFAENTSLKLGRQEMMYGEHVIIGNVGYSNIGRSFDAGLLRFSLGDHTVDTFYSRLAENDFNSPGLAGNDDFAGVYASLRSVSFFDELDFYGLWLRRARNPGPNAFHFGTFGSRFIYKKGGWDGRFEGALQVGKMAGADMLAYMVLYEEGYTFNVLKGLRIAGEYNLASGDDATTGKFTRFHSMFPTAHKFFGYLDLFGRQNIQSGVFHAKLKINDKWSAAADVHSFWRVQTSDALYGLGAEALIAGLSAVPTNTKKHAGEEVDLTLNFKASKHVAFQAVGSIFLPGAYMKREIGDDIAYFSYLQAHFKM